MRWSRIRNYLAGLVAFLIGMPLSEQTFAGTSDIIDASFNLADAIASAIDSNS